MTEQVVEVKFPPKFKLVKPPERLKFLRGGRGSGKSWSIARHFLLLGTQKPTRFLCTREVQKSIKQSVHQLLSDQINALCLQNFYEVLATEIRGANGTVFYFAGLSDQTADSLKSFEGVDYCWVEEAHSISSRSLKILRPTIRRKGSEIWFSYNPELDTDPVHVLAQSDLASSIVVNLNHSDNPWFPDVLEKERLEAKATMSEAEYNHVWEGRCLPAVSGAIFFDEIDAAEQAGRITRFDFDPLLKTHTIWDLGFNDSMFICFVQRVASEVRIVKAIEDNKRTLISYINDDIKPLGLNWGSDYLPHDGYAQRHQSGKSDAEVMRALGRHVPGDSSYPSIPNMTVEEGIRRAREVFPRVWFNSKDPGVQRLIECLKRYRRHISKSTNEPSKPVHDEYSHGADCFRYVCLVADQLKNDAVKPATKRSSRAQSKTSWMS